MRAFNDNAEKNIKLMTNYFCLIPAFLGFTCPPVENNSIYSGGETRFFRSPSDCQHYFVCVEGRPRLLNCGEGNAFNELVNACDGAENVTGWSVFIPLKSMIE